MASFAKSCLNLVLVAQAVTMILYSLLATALVPSVWADPLGPLFRCWFALGWPAFAAVLVIFHLMIQKPAL
ncbi:MAG TPA: DoxX-like family protein [Bradyrhizobium sp.]|nr:DoxX-like family protein [Bradyrhizobium sp.]